MAGNRRSFIREILQLIPILKTEYDNQVNILLSEEANINEVLVEITPLKGYYAHASFLFRVQVTSNYPFKPPHIFCLTNVFHPNINSNSYDSEICLNILYSWGPQFGLKDLLHALLFLFYEPNFDDPINEWSYPEKGLTIEETIHKSLRGGLINSRVYEPNVAWLNWMEDNGAQRSAETNPESRIHDATEENPPSPLRQQSTVSNYFRMALSGQYSPMLHSFRDSLQSTRSVSFASDHAYMRQITIRPASEDLSTEELVCNARRYYFAEQCGCSQSDVTSGLDQLCIHDVSRYYYAEAFRSGQMCTWRSCSLTPYITSIVFEDEFFTHSPLRDNDYQNDFNHFSIDNTCVYEEVINSNAEVSVAAEHVETPNEQEDTYNSEPPPNPDSMDEMTDDSEKGQLSASPPNVEASGTNSVNELNEDDVWDETSFSGDKNNDSESETEVIYFTASKLYLSSTLKSHNKSMMRLSPWWWIMYQSRWPVYLGPRHLSRIKRFKQKLYFSRASTAVLRSDLYRIGVQYNKPTLFLLVDSLSLSPLSPMLNRAVTFRGQNGRSVHWCGLDWYSLWDAMRSNGCGISSPRIHFRLPSFMFILCYVHNWLAYMSRLELYGSCLGYSRPLRPGVLSNAASTCIVPASLGCGQCSVLDMWPLWLMWRVSRQLCRLAVFLCSRAIYVEECSGPIRTSVCFPFSDLDEI